MGNCLGSSSTNPSNKPDNNNHNSIGSPATSSSTTTTNTAGGNKSQFSIATSSADQGGNFDEENKAVVNPDGQLLESPKLKVFTFADLKAATKNFKADSLLGQGGFGKVYKGWVDETTLAPTKPGNGIVVAIKKLNPDSDSGQGFREWQSEVNFLGRLSHPNLVKLLGYCWEEEDLLLVYEFMQKGSLENHLFRRSTLLEPLSWNTRLKIAIGAARGLAFLHSSEKQIIYRDFKASNILLDGNYNAKISDFGLAKLGPPDGDTHVSTRIIGTRGYAAPEYIATGHLYVKSDVYGFGVVLLEMMTGLRALDNSRPKGQQNLVDWMKPILQKRKVKTIMDSKLGVEYSSKAILLAASLILKCLEPDPRRRPSMNEIVDDLLQIQDIKEKPSLITKISISTLSASSHSSSSSSTNNHRGRRSPLHSRPQGS